MSEIPGSDGRSGIGARLRAGRERMGMTLLQVAEKMHVDAKVLEALEAERFGELGAPVYVKGHLKRYSELVSENTAQILDQYSTATKPVLPDLTQLPKASRSADPKKLVLPSLVVLIAFALIGTVWWVLQNLNTKTSFGRPATPQQVPATSEPELGTTAADAGSPPGEAPAAPPAAVPSTTPAASRPRTPPAPTANAVGAPAAQPQAQGTATPEPARLKSIDVTLKFAADSWAEVYDASGQRLFYDIGAANSSRTLTGTPPLRVVLGNAPGVSVNINGRAATVPASAVHEDSAQFVINRSGRIVRARTEAAAPASKPNGE